METLDPARVKDWLDNWEGKQVIYPNVAKAIAQWVANGDWEKPESRAELAKTLWSQTRANGVKSFETNPTPESVKPCPPDEAVA